MIIETISHLLSLRMVPGVIRASAIEIDFTVTGSFSDDDDERDFRGGKGASVFLKGNITV